VKGFLVAMVLPGNYYPATEHPFVVPFVQDPSIEGDDKRKPNPVGLLGQACKGGYQSHYSVIDTKSFAAPFPTQFDDFEDHEKKRVVSDELVVFEGAQALPLFLVYYKTPTSPDSPDPLPDKAPSQSTSSQPQGEFSCGVGLFGVDLIFFLVRCLE